MKKAGVLLGLGGFVFFLWCFYVRYYKWRDCFNELGRCYDPDGSRQVYTTAGVWWGWISVVFLVIAIVSAAYFFVSPGSGSSPRSISNGSATGSRPRNSR